MDEQYVVMSRGGGTETREGEFRVVGPFPSFEVAEHWSEQEFGTPEQMSEAKLAYFEIQIVRIETPKEF
jgi:hypothetical protein